MKKWNGTNWSGNRSHGHALWSVGAAAFRADGQEIILAGHATPNHILPAAANGLFESEG
jgi:hypothetical protein